MVDCTRRLLLLAGGYQSDAVGVATPRCGRRLGRRAHTGGASHLRATGDAPATAVTSLATRPQRRRHLALGQDCATPAAAARSVPALGIWRTFPAVWTSERGVPAILPPRKLVLLLGGGELFALALSRMATGGDLERGAVPMEERKEDKENDTQKMNRNGNPNVPRW